jgi:hypothetical protein
MRKTVSIFGSGKMIVIETGKGTFSVGVPVLQLKQNKMYYPQLPINNFQYIFSYHTS